jgi:hypothetical protein
MFEKYSNSVDFHLEIGNKPIQIVYYRSKDKTATGSKPES